MTRKRILLVNPSHSAAGGAEKLTDSLARLLSSRYDVVQVSFDPPGTAPHFRNHLPYEQLGPVPRFPLPLRWISYLTLAYRLSRLKKKHRTDVTISALWRADLVSILSGGSDHKIALVLIDIQGNPANRLMVKLRALVAPIYRRFDRVLAINRAIGDEMRDLYQVPVARIGVFRNFLARPEPATVSPTDGLRRYVFCGRLAPEKNPEGLLAAWSRFARQDSGVQLVILGDGPLHERCLALADEHGLSRGTQVSDTVSDVLFIGTVSRPEDFLSGAHAFVLTSRNEGAPTVLLLALAMGLPVLAADAAPGGVRELLGAERDPEGAPLPVKAGLLMPIPEPTLPRSLEAWRHGLNLINGDEGQREQWRKGAVATWEPFSPERVLHFWEDEIERLANPSA